MIKKYLKELQKLQILAFDSGVNMQIGTRHNTNLGPFITIDINIEGVDFVNDVEKKDHDSFFLHEPYPFWTKEENIRDYERILNSIKEFIKNHTNHED